MYIYERVREHPVPASAPSEEAVIAGLPVQLSEAVAVPAEGKLVGLQPKLDEAGQEVKVGASVSTV